MKSVEKNYKYLFGPVPSRRLGKSLGVDLIPDKTCTLDCIYCECGRTTNLTIKREEFFKLKEIRDELDDFLKDRRELDYITFGGRGEPTLYSKIGDLALYVKEKYPQYQLALITNATLFDNCSLIEEIIPFDLIIPSLDAVSLKTMQKINNPSPNLIIEKILDGLKKLGEKFKGKIWLELFVLPGINDNLEELKKIKEFLKTVRFDKIQLNTLDRPGTELELKRANYQALEIIKKFLSPLNVEIISKFKGSKVSHKSLSKDDQINLILNTLARRPCTIFDLEVIFESSKTELLNLLDEIEKKGFIKRRWEERGIFFYKIVSRT